MTETDTERKPLGDAEFSAEEARKSFTELLGRAAFGKERIVVTRNGKQFAAIVGMADLERLVALDLAKQPAAQSAA